jgi:hypothetical protein
MFKATGEEFVSIYAVTSVKSALVEFIRSWSWVYPSEIICEGMLVDLAAMTWHKELYGFEIKEEGDKISVGIEQCKQYLSGFDRVYLAGVVTPKKETLLRIERLGLGYIQVKFSKEPEATPPRTDARLHCLLIAPLNHPVPEVRANIRRKFDNTIDKTKTQSHAEPKQTVLQPIPQGDAE